MLKYLLRNIPNVTPELVTCYCDKKTNCFGNCDSTSEDDSGCAMHLQIYNEQVSDLLDTESQNLSIREDSKRGMFVDGLQEVVVSSAEATYSVFKRGSQNRQTGLTAMNEESSRSHSVFTIKMESQVRHVITKALI